VSLGGKAALVTGASSGIGAAVAVALGGRGARVALAARRVERIEEVAARVRAAGGEAAVMPADLRDEEAVRTVVAWTRERFGRLDALVNNAGLAIDAPLSGGVPAAWRHMWELNVHALAVATSEALRRFPPEGGHVVHISSMAGHRVPPGGGFYAATKFAVRALTEALRQELRAAGSPHRVSAISPGFVETEFMDVFHGGAEEARLRHHPYRYLDPEDVARAVLHVLEAPPHCEVHDVLLRPRDQPT
jgi:NADP-dependent 3-hydroxy acid dehydrogenase YdfG